MLGLEIGTEGDGLAPGSVLVEEASVPGADVPGAGENVGSETTCVDDSSIWPPVCGELL